MEEEIDLRQYVDVIRRWLWLIVLSTVLAGGTAYFVSLNMTPVYQASTTLRIISPSNSLGRTDLGALQIGQRLAGTYAQLLGKGPVLDGVISNLGLEISARRLEGAVKVQLVRSTDLIEITAENTDPAIAQAIANEIPNVFSQQDQAQRSSQYSQIKASLTEELDRLEEKVGQLQKAIAEKTASGTEEKDTVLIILESDLEQARSNYSTMLQNYSNVQLAEVQSSSSVVVVVPAKVPEKPIRPRTRLNTLLAAVVGAMVAIGVVFLIEYLDDTVKTPDDVRALLGVPTIGMVARSPRSKGGADSYGRVVTMGSTHSPLSEAYRVLRANIRFSSVDNPVQTLQVTSAGPNEGKSTIAVNLGVVMAQAGKRIILVETDLRRPVLHKEFDVPNQNGLTNALVANDLGLDELLLDTTVENLQFITSGPLPPNPSELLESQRMNQLVEHLKSMADIILLDSPPVMVAADAAIIANLVDGTLVVIDSGTTRQDAALQAFQTLKQGGTRILGVVLNNLPLAKRGYYYYYSDYYSSDGQSGTQHGHRWSSGVRSIWNRLRRRSR